MVSASFRNLSSEKSSSSMDTTESSSVDQTETATGTPDDEQLTQSEEQLTKSEEEEQRQAENLEEQPAKVDAKQPIKFEQPESCTLQKPRSYKEPLPMQESDFGLQWLKLNSGSSNMLISKSKNNLQKTTVDVKDLRVALYEAPVPSKAIIEESKVNLLSPIEYQAQVEEPKIELLPPEVHQVVVEEPKAELLSPEAQKALVEEVRLGILKVLSKNIDDNVILLDNDEENSKEKNEITNETDDTATPVEAIPILQTVDSCTACRSKMLERQTQTARPKSPNHRPRLTRVSIAHMQGMKSSMCVAGTSSDNCSSEQPQKLKITTQPQNTFKQRQLELHRHRISVEQKRMELLELKLARERDEMLRESILFEKELEFKNAQIRKINEDRIEL